MGNCIYLLICFTIYIGLNGVNTIAAVEDDIKLETKTSSDISGKHFENEDLDEKNMCETIRKTYYPRTAKNTNGDMVHIVNTEDFKQGFSIETCSENSNCFMNGFLPIEYETSCKQQYTTTKVTVLNKNHEVSIMDTIIIPTTCVCVFKKKLSS